MASEPEKKAPKVPYEFQRDEPESRVRAMVSWVMEVLEQSGIVLSPSKEEDPALQLLIDGVSQLCLENGITDVEELTDADLEVLADSIAKLSLGDHGKSQETPAPRPWRCWTTGTSQCGCTRLPSPNRRPGDDSHLDVACDMDCPVGESTAETAVELEKEFQCGWPDCFCVLATDTEEPPGLEEHPDVCLRTDCECRRGFME